MISTCGRFCSNSFFPYRVFLIQMTIFCFPGEAETLWPPSSHFLCTARWGLPAQRKIPMRNSKWPTTFVFHLFFFVLLFFDDMHQRGGTFQDLLANNQAKEHQRKSSWEDYNQFHSLYQ